MSRGILFYGLCHSVHGIPSWLPDWAKEQGGDLLSIGYSDKLEAMVEKHGCYLHVYCDRLLLCAARGSESNKLVYDNWNWGSNGPVKIMLPDQLSLARAIIRLRRAADAIGWPDYLRKFAWWWLTDDTR